MTWLDSLKDWVLSPVGGTIIGGFAGFAEDLGSWRASVHAARANGSPEPDFSLRQSLRRVLSRALAGMGIGIAASG